LIESDTRYLRWLIGAKGSRLLREKQQLKIPQIAVFASEEAEALPAESDCPQRESTCSYVAVYINYERLKVTQLTKRASLLEAYL